MAPVQPVKLAPVDPWSGDPLLAKPLLWESRGVASPLTEQSKTSLLQGVILGELRLCQARAAPAWESQIVLISQTSDLPHPFTSSQVPPNLPSLVLPPDGDTLVWVALCGIPYMRVLKEVS